MYKLENKVSHHKSQVTDEGYQKIVDKGWKNRFKVLEHVPDDPNAKPKELKKSFTPPEVTALKKPDDKKSGKGKTGK